MAATGTLVRHNRGPPPEATPAAGYGPFTHT